MLNCEKQKRKKGVERVRNGNARVLNESAESVKSVFRKWEAKFAAIQDETLRQRADDILDLARRVLRQLEGADAFGLATMPAGSVLVT